MAFDWKFHSVNYFAHWVKDMRMFCYYIAIVVTIGGARSATPSWEKGLDRGIGNAGTRGTHDGLEVKEGAEEFERITCVSLLLSVRTK